MLDAGVFDNAGFGDRGQDVGDATHHVVSTEEFGECWFVVESVLERDDGRVVTDERSWGHRCGLGVEGFHAEQDVVAFADIGWVVRRGEVESCVPVDALDPQPVRLECPEVFASFDDDGRPRPPARDGRRSTRRRLPPHRLRPSYPNEAANST